VDCGIPFGDSTFILASLDESAISIGGDMHRLVGGTSGLSCHAAFPVAYYSCVNRANFLAGSFDTDLTKYFCAKIDKEIRWAFASALEIDLLAAPADDVPDAAFTADRAQLPARLGCAGISLLSNRHLYLNMLTTALPQLIDRVGEDGTVTPGVFNDQAARKAVGIPSWILIVRLQWSFGASLSGPRRSNWSYGVDLSPRQVRCCR
jgi:hypothetical protein